MRTSNQDLFDEDSSDDSDGEEEKKEPKPAEEVGASKEEGEGGAAKEESEGGAAKEESEGGAAKEESQEGAAEETKAEESKKPDTTALFGEPDSDDSDDEDGEGDKKGKDPEKEKEGEQEKEAEKEEEKKGNDSSNRLTIDDSSDEDDANGLFDDVVGSSAPSKPKNKPVVPVGDEYGDDSLKATAGAPLSSASQVVRPPKEATVLNVDRPDPKLSLFMTKLPNLIGIQSEEFDPDTFDAEKEEEEYRGHVHNMVRWRYKRDKSGNVMKDDKGNHLRESNSRIVQWSDGSFTLHIGKEVFDVDALDAKNMGADKDKPTVGGGLSGFLYVSQKAVFGKKDEEEEEEDDEQENNGTVLECMGSIKSRLLARPSSLQSKAHKSLTLAVRQRAVKRRKIEKYVTQVDPEKEKAERIRNKSDVDKVQARKKASSRYASRYRSPGMNRKYIEEDDGRYDGVSLRNLKRNADMDDDMDDYGEEESDDDYGGFRDRSSSRKRKARKEEEEEEELVFDAESDEDDVAIIKAHKKKRPQQNMFDDDDD